MNLVLTFATQTFISSKLRLSKRETLLASLQSLLIFLLSRHPVFYLYFVELLGLALSTPIIAP